jgi:poly-gamma-glutamate synthesis protein (capsule biosynthesis protein)
MKYKISRIPIFFVLLLIASVGVYLIFSNRPKAPEIVRAYHQSQFPQYAALIDSSVERAKSGGKVDLDNVMGGVVSHHVPTTIPTLADFYIRLRNTRSVKTFVILGPDHTDASMGDINVSKADFVMPFGTLKPDLNLIAKLEKSGYAVNDEKPFDQEHSVGSQMLLISKLFPDARIVPIILRSSLTNETAKAFGRVLAQSVDENTFIVASVDFSHYLSERQARPIDYLSANVLGALNLNSTNLIEADSVQSLTTLMSYLDAKGASQYADLQIRNTGDYNDDKDYTTGYVFGFWGIKNNASSGQINLNSDSKEISLLFVGDIMLSRSIGSIMAKKSDWRYPFLEIKDFLKNADVVFGNLEGPISARGAKMGSMYSFRSDPRVIGGLLYAGFEVLSVANNHIWDYGPEAFKDTLDILKNNGISYIGGGYDYAEANTPAMKEVKGNRIAFLGYTNLLPVSLGAKSSKPAVALPDINQLTRDIEEAKKSADIIVVSFHWGDEYATKHNKGQETLAHAAIDAGAQLVIGHHPHVVQDIEEYKGGYIAYSLGNFVFDQNFSTDTKTGLVLKITLKDKKVSQVEKYRIGFTTSYQPFVLAD